jgi:hypothetical protein
MKSIAAALVAAQKGFAPALKQSMNPHFKSKYVDLAGCVEAVIDSLNTHGIALIQRTYEDTTGVTVETVFLHESGEVLECGKLHVPAAKQDPQGYGSALTYARRYSLMAACGIAPEDDDGNAASKKPITPVKAAMQSVEMNDEDMMFLKSLAAELVQMVEVEGKVIEAFKHLEAQRLDSDQKIALWDILAPNSKVRSTLKKIAQEQRLQDEKRN